MKYYSLLLLSLLAINCIDNNTTTINKSSESNFVFVKQNEFTQIKNNQLRFTIQQDSIGINNKVFSTTSQSYYSAKTAYINVNLHNVGNDTVNYIEHTCSWTELFATREKSNLFINHNICFSNGIGTTKIPPNCSKNYSIQVFKDNPSSEFNDTLELSFTLTEKFESPSQSTTIWSNKIVLIER